MAAVGGEKDVLRAVPLRSEKAQNARRGGRLQRQVLWSGVYTSVQALRQETRGKRQALRQETRGKRQTDRQTQALTYGRSKKRDKAGPGAKTAHPAACCAAPTHLRERGRERVAQGRVAAQIQRQGRKG